MILRFLYLTKIHLEGYFLEAEDVLFPVFMFPGIIRFLYQKLKPLSKNLLVIQNVAKCNI